MAPPVSLQEVKHIVVVFSMQAHVGLGSHDDGTLMHVAFPKGPESGGGGGPPETL
jgi:hypothetical protein